MPDESREQAPWDDFLADEDAHTESATNMKNDSEEAPSDEDVAHGFDQTSTTGLSDHEHEPATDKRQSDPDSGDKAEEPISLGSMLQGLRQTAAHMLEEARAEAGRAQDEAWDRYRAKTKYRRNKD